MQPETTATSTWRSGIEGRSIEWIPPDERHGKVRQQAPFWFLCNFHPLTVALGLVGPTLGLSLLWTIVAVTAGVLFGTVFLALHGSQGPNLGLPQMIQSRAQLGYRGVVVILFAAVFTFLGYNVVDTVMIDAGFHDLFGWNSTITGLGVGVGAIVLAVWGHDWLHRAFTVMFWVSLPLWLILTFGALFGGAGGAPVADLGFHVSAFVVMFTIGATYNITYAPIVSDYTRYLPVDVSSRALIMTVYWGAAIAAIWMMALGAWLGARFGVADTFVGIHDATNAVIPWAGTALVVISGLALVSTMGLNTYSATLTVLTAIDCFVPRFGTPLRRAVTAVVLGAASTAIGVWVVHDISAAINNALLIMLYLLAPWTALNLVDYFIVRRGHYDVAEILNPDGVYGTWAWRGLTAYGLGVAAEIPFVTLTFYHGPIARALGGVDVAFAVSLAVAGMAFYLLSRWSMTVRTESTSTSLHARPSPHTASNATTKGEIR